MKIGIVGGGVVGAATAQAFLGHVEEVRVYDLMRERRTHGLDDTLGADLVFVCVPEDAVEVVFDLISEVEEGRGRYALRSSVPIGTTLRLAQQYPKTCLCHNPEFLTERTAVQNALMPVRHVVGTPGGALPLNSATLALIRLLYSRFPGTPCYYCSSDESELIKLADNAWGAVKVAWWNELYSLCHQRGMNWFAVRQALLAGGRISPIHTLVPGPDLQYGFGGKCLPKDAQEFVNVLLRSGLRADVTAAALARNEDDRGRMS